MNYLVTLKPLEPFLFGGDNTFGVMGDEQNSTYLVKSREFPQQSALQGMLKKEMMKQAGVLTRKVRGEWVDKHSKDEAKKLVGVEKFNIESNDKQDFGDLQSISPLFLMRNGKKYIKKVDIDSYELVGSVASASPKGGAKAPLPPFRLKKLNSQNKYYSDKDNMHDNFIATDNSEKLSSENIFTKVEQVGIKKGGGDNAFFKKISLLLKPNFVFAFFMESDFELKDSIISLGADSSPFQLRVTKSDDKLEHNDKNGYLTLLSDAYITLRVEKHCDFAITSEISYRTLSGKRSSMTQNEKKEKNSNNNPFTKSKKIFLYEKGSVFINPSDGLLENLNRQNCQQIGYNNYTQGTK